MNALDRCLARDAEWTARTNVIRLRPIILPPHPPEPTFEQRLQATVIALRDAFLSGMAALSLAGLCALAVGVYEGALMEPVAEVVPMERVAIYAFRGGFGD